MNLKFFILAFAAVTVMFGSVRAQWFSWESKMGLSYDQIVTAAAEMGPRGYTPLRIESSFENGEQKFAAIWIKEADLSKQRWQLGVRMNDEMFRAHVDEQKNKGFAPVDVAVTTVKGEPVFSMISGTGAWDTWQSRHGLTAQEVIARTNEYSRSGMGLLDINAYPTPEGMRFAGIWADAGFDGQINAIALTKSQFDREVSRLPAGFIPFNINVGSIAGETVYSGIFIKDDSKLYKVKYDLNEAELRAFFNEQVNAGYAPHALTAYNIRLQPKFAAVFSKDRPVETKSNPVYTLPNFTNQNSIGRTLDIAPVEQQTKVWCWLAVGEMVFRHFGVRSNNLNNFQCGIIGTLMSATECYSNCFNPRCIRPSGSNYATVSMLRDYAWMSSRRVLRADEGYELGFAAIKANIDAGKPIIAGVSPTRRQYYDGAEHVALIVGYEAGAGGVNVIVNDPYPYPPFGNPYTLSGAKVLSKFQYRMPLRNFTQDLYWHWSIHNINVQ